MRIRCVVTRCKMGGGLISQSLRASHVAAPSTGAAVVLSSTRRGDAVRGRDYRRGVRLNKSIELALTRPLNEGRVFIESSDFLFSKREEEKVCCNSWLLGMNEKHSETNIKSGLFANAKRKNGFSVFRL